MSETVVTINGIVKLTNSGKPISYVRVEMWDSSGEYGRISSTVTNPNGEFTMIIGGELATIISDGEHDPEYRVFQGSIFLGTDPGTVDGDVRIISISDDAYDTALPDSSTGVTSLSHFTVQGTVKDKNGVVITVLKVKVYETGFRIAKTLLSECMPDAHGQFNIKISTKYLSNTNVLSKRSIALEAVSISGETETVSAFTDDIFMISDPLTVDLITADGYNAPSAFTGYLNLIDEIIGDTAIADLEIDPTTGINEIKYIAAAAGIPEEHVLNIFNAHKLASEASVNVQYCYGLIRARGVEGEGYFPTTDNPSGISDTNPLMRLRAQEIWDTLSRSQAENIIGDEAEIAVTKAAFITSVLAYQQSKTKEVRIQGEEYTIDDVLKSVFGADGTGITNINNFLSKANSKSISTGVYEDYTDTEDFWTSYNSTYGDTLTKKAQKGMQLVTVTGYQPEMISHLISANSDPLYALAKWDAEDWDAAVDDVFENSEAENIPVPSIIRGDVTWGSSSGEIGAVKTKYAEFLANAVQNIYPLVNICSKLEVTGETGGITIIPDAEERADVIDFINDNPTFDLRMNSVFDINGEDYDVTGVDDLEQLKDSLGRFQRLIRLTVGMPGSVVEMVKDGLDSSKSIVEIGREDFLDAYSEKLGGEEIANAVFSRALTTYSLTHHYTANAVVNGSSTAGSPVIPYMSFEEEGSGGEPAPSLPSLSTLFGSLDFCTCDQCMSMYSPAAYLTDTLHFLKTNALPAYTELMKRRADIKHIDLTCKNANTPLPYIDLVNELLENKVLAIIGDTVPNSFQTGGTKAQLASYPQHVVKNSGVYENYINYIKVYQDVPPSTNGVLNRAFYPNNLPFSLPTEETRVYLKYLGLSRTEAMDLFMPLNVYSTTSTTEVTNYLRYTEMLGLTKFSTDIISQSSGITDVYKFFGFLTSSLSSWPDPTNTGSNIVIGTPPFTWDTLLKSRLDVLLVQARITYKELQEMLLTDFLNKIVPVGSPVEYVRPVNIKHIVGKNAATCKLDELRLDIDNAGVDFTAVYFFERLHRYIRLYRTSTLSVYKWDIMLRSFEIQDLDGSTHSSTNGTYLDLELVGMALELSERLKIEPQILAGWWSNLDLHGSLDHGFYIDYDTDTLERMQSVYASVFDNKTVMINDIQDDNIFADVGGILSSTYLFGPFTAKLAALCLIGESELKELMSFFGLTAISYVTTENVSRLYTVCQIAKSFNFSINEMVSVLKMSDVLNDLTSFTDNPPYGSTVTFSDYLDALKKLCEVADAIKRSGFTVTELNYLISNIDPELFYFPLGTDVVLFYTTLRDGLLKLPQFVAPDPGASDEEKAAAGDLIKQLAYYIYQQFSKQFDLPVVWVQYLLDGTTPVDWDTSSSSSFSVYLVTDSLFDNNTTDLTESDLTPSSPPSYANEYRLIHKISYITNRLRIRNREFISLYGGTNVINFDLLTLFVDVDPTTFQPQENSSPTTLFDGLLRLARWMEVRDTLSLVDGALPKLWSIDTTNASTKIDWLTFFANNTKWGDRTVTLIGEHDEPTLPPGTAGTNLLRTTYTTDFTFDEYDNISLILRINEIVNWCNRTGLEPNALRNVLLPGVDLSGSHEVLLAAKGKQTDEGWEKVARPLRDPIRKKQRDALVGWLLANPPGSLSSPIVANKYAWRNENDLYAYLLIDTQMQPVMLTSRIKQAISSVQLFIDRVRLHLEYADGNLASLITATSGFVNQWKSWRKWYGIWEANREIFLYPENWLEPDLRDDKTEFFKDFQTELLQEEVTKDSVEKALRHYLHKLDEVARLQPVGTCDTKDPITNKVVTHVFARTFGNPQIYYYRRLVDDIWSGWEKMDIDIKSDQIMPVCWNNRVYIFWITFIDKKVKANRVIYDQFMKPKQNTLEGGRGNFAWFYNDMSRPNEEPDVNDNDAKYYGQIEITLNWSEYKDGRWQKSRLGKDNIKMNLNPWEPQDMKDLFSVTPHWVGNFYAFLTQNKELSVTELTKARFYIYPQLNTTTNSLSVHLLYPKAYFTDDDYNMSYIHSFYFADPGSEPIVVKDRYTNISQVSPQGTANSNMHFKQYQPWATGDGKLFKDTYGLPKNINQYVYIYEGNKSMSVRNRSSSQIILNKTPAEYGAFRLRVKSNFQSNPLENQFFYIDDKNTFFVRAINQPTGIWASNAAEVKAAPVGQQVQGGFSAGTVYQNTEQYNPISSSIGKGESTDPPPPPPGPTSTLPFIVSPSTAPLYYFQTFYHPFVHEFIKALYIGGIDGLYSPKLQSENQVFTETMNFSGKYLPTALVYNTAPYNYPKRIVDQDYNGAYSIYNWEIFYHIPMSIAQSLSANQKFEDAQKWYHYIFDPTSNLNVFGAPDTYKTRFWKFYKFYELTTQPIQSLVDLLTAINNPTNNAVAIAQVTAMQTDPLQPYAIARIRQLAFMKNVVMKYLDNLIAWGDQLFSRSSIESINEATQLYILASNILGPRPQEIHARTQAAIKSFAELDAAGTLDALGNAMVNIENFVDINAGISSASYPATNVSPTPMKMFYFCIPENQVLLKYWDTIADRLYKIRNSLNIKGQFQQLPLFEPPINPMALIRAAAAGVDLGTVLDEISGANLPKYRFSYMLQKANEICGDVKALGGALLSALEKKDGEEMALLRSGLELTVLQGTLLMKKTQLDEANANLEALNKSRDITMAKYVYYSTRVFQNDREKEHIQSMGSSIELVRSQSTMAAISSAMSLIPQFHAQATFAVGLSFGGQQLATIFQAISTNLGFQAAIKNTSAGIASTVGGYQRRQDDWTFQAQSAQKELDQIDKQIVAAGIRISLAEKDVDMQQIQIENNRAIDDFMRSKYTNKDLYNWMVTQLSTTYFQAYQLAYRLAKKAGNCFDFELPFADNDSTKFITSGYWDSLRKGLLTGEKLGYDLRKLEAAYIDQNERELELTKHISLGMLDPDSLIELRESGQCTFDIPTWLFNLDYPGHYYRRIKSVSITIPAVAGPYTTIAAELSLGINAVYGTSEPAIKAPGAEDFVPASPTPEFSYNSGGLIATSSAQNDNGLFDFNFRDERYLPFEGRGAHSRWTLSLMQEKQLRQFDFNAISDVIIHMKYTARTDGFNGTKASGSITALTNLLTHTSSSLLMPRYFSLRHELINDWNSAFSQTVNNDSSNNVARPFNLNIQHDQFPFYCRGRVIHLSSISIYLAPSLTGAGKTFKMEGWSSGNTSGAPITPTPTLSSPTYFGTISLSSVTIPVGGSKEIDLKLYKVVTGTDTIVNESEVADIYLVFNYYFAGS